MSTREERAEATRAQLLASATELFTVRGYAAVGTEDVVRAAGLTRGALYHHFADKRELFAAVHEEQEQRLVARIAEDLARPSPGAGPDTDPLAVLARGVRVYLDLCLEPTVLRITLQDAPTVLGWARWREVGTHYGLGLITGALDAAMQAGVLRPAPVRPLAQLLMGALSEAAHLIAHAEDRAATRAEVEPALLGLLEGLRA
jgi:AcrR family transcriptional regulator